MGKWKYIFVFSGLGFGALVVGVGCAKGFKALSADAISSIDQSSLWSEGEVGMGLGTGYTLAMSPLGNIALPAPKSDCLTDASVDTCLFRNGPIYQDNKVFEPYVTVSTNLSKLQTWGVNVVDTDGSGYLSNEYIDVSLDDGSRARENNGSWKFPFSSKQSALNYLQVHQYVYMTALRQLLVERGGSFTAPDTPVFVMAMSKDAGANAYFDFGSNQVALGVDRGEQLPLGIDADVGLHEYGHSILHFTSGQRDKDRINTVTCSSGRGACCETKSGCIGAIHEGQADFHVAIMNPNDPRIATAWLNTLQGLRNPAADRDVITKNVTLQVHQLGRIYASIWYEVYRKTNFSNDIVRLFVEHQKTLTGSDDFQTARVKIKSLDRVFFKSRYSAEFDAQYLKRGL